LYEILDENGFNFKPSTKGLMHFLRSPYLSSVKDGGRYVSLFGEHTTKGIRLNFLINSSEKSPFSEKEALISLERLTSKNHLSKFTISDFLSFIKKKKTFHKYEIMHEFDISHATFWKYALIFSRLGPGNPTSSDVG
jgi:hypothetical protein